MPLNEVNKVFDQSGSGYGIGNIVSRLRLMYGDGVGFAPFPQNIVIASPKCMNVSGEGPCWGLHAQMGLQIAPEYSFGTFKSSQCMEHSTHL